MEVVDRLAGVLLEVQALDADGDALVRRHIDRDLALADDRALVLADLVALRQVRVEIVLAVEHALQVDFRLQPEPGADRLAHAFLVDDRQHARHGGVHEGDVAVRLAPEGRGGAREQLGLARHLGMDLHADDDLPIAKRALDELLRVRRSLNGRVHRRPSPPWAGGTASPRPASKGPVKAGSIPRGIIGRPGRCGPRGQGSSMISDEERIDLCRPPTWRFTPFAPLVGRWRLKTWPHVGRNGLPCAPKLASRRADLSQRLRKLFAG